MTRHDAADIGIAIAMTAIAIAMTAIAITTLIAVYTARFTL